MRIPILSVALLLQAWSWASLGRQKKETIHLLKSDWAMILNIGISYALLLAAIYAPGLSTILRTTPLSMLDIVVVLVSALTSMLISSLIVRGLGLKLSRSFPGSTGRDATIIPR